MTFAIFLVIAYLIGSIPFCLLLGKLKGVDIRRVGSGNSGATNLTRVAGPIYGLVGYILDAVKGLVVVSIFWNTPNAQLWQAVVVGLVAVIAHVFPIYTKKGGKGVATSGGVFLVFSFWGFLGALAVWLIVVGKTQYVSLGSVLAAASLPVIQLIRGNAWSEENIYITIFAFVLFMVIVFTHRENISRLKKGQENKINLKRKSA